MRNFFRFLWFSVAGIYLIFLGGLLRPYFPNFVADATAFAGAAFRFIGSFAEQLLNWFPGGLGKLLFGDLGPETIFFTFFLVWVLVITAVAVVQRMAVGSWAPPEGRHAILSTAFVINYGLLFIWIAINASVYEALPIKYFILMSGLAYVALGVQRFPVPRPPEEDGDRP